MLLVSKDKAKNSLRLITEIDFCFADMFNTHLQSDVLIMKPILMFLASNLQPKNGRVQSILLVLIIKSQTGQKLIDLRRLFCLLKWTGR